MDPVNVKGYDGLDLTKHGSESTQGANRWRQMADNEKKAAVHAEITKVNQLPTNSSYAVHRMRVLNKILQLMSTKRTVSQDEELGLLFAGLSL